MLYSNTKGELNIKALKPQLIAIVANFVESLLHIRKVNRILATNFSTQPSILFISRASSPKNYRLFQPFFLGLTL